jgi:hypothetical protein
LLMGSAIIFIWKPGFRIPVQTLSYGAGKSGMTIF